MAISAQTLFHFTQYQYLQSILKSKAFFPRYCFEPFINQEDFIVAFPVSCFCDIPLSQISDHANTYHRNGIGLQKSWGISNGLNPLFYLQKESYPSAIILDIFKSLLEKRKTLKDKTIAIETTDPIFIKAFFELISYYKPREGRNWIKETNDFEKFTGATAKSGDKIINFYDEREWRYVPKINFMEKTDSVPLNFKLKDYFYDDNIFREDKFRESNSELEKYPLTFEASDIKYIIVSRSSDVNNMAKFIYKLDGSIYSADEKNLLVSKIISLTQIKEDF
jgi:hypothetical protein